jgi:hypothetical protein
LLRAALCCHFSRAAEAAAATTHLHKPDVIAAHDLFLEVAVSECDHISTLVEAAAVTTCTWGREAEAKTPIATHVSTQYNSYAGEEHVCILDMCYTLGMHVPT